MMSMSLAKLFVEQLESYVNKNHIHRLNLIWHGGEPLLWGTSNYSQIFEVIWTAFKNIHLKISIQTNLSLLNERYIELFKRYNVHVGFSLDGEQDINDTQRVYPDGGGTFEDIMSKVALCREKGVSIGCIVVGSRKHVGKIRELYSFLTENKLNFKFNPLFISGEAKNNDGEYGITPNEYATMAIELFDLWYNDERNEIIESNFTEIASNLVTGKTSHCLFGSNCQDNFFAIGPDGDVFPCGRFCDEAYNDLSYGNIKETPLEEILKRRVDTEPYKRASYIAAGDCSKCIFFNICHGGCLHEGFLQTGDFKHKTFLCSAYKKIFSHISSLIRTS